MKILFVRFVIVNVACVLNAILFIPPMIGAQVRSLPWAVAYFAGFMLISVVSFYAQVAANERSIREYDAKRSAEAHSAASSNA